MRGPLAAFVPKPGVYLTDNVYYYDAGRSDVTPIGDRVVGNISAEALMNIAQFSWVTDVSVMGGRLAFSGLLPYGNLKVGGSVAVPVPPFAVKQSDDVTALGDPVIGASVGWKHRDGDRFQGLERVLVAVHPGRRLRGRAPREHRQEPVGVRRRGRLHHGELQGWSRVLDRPRFHVQRREPRYELRLRQRDAPRNGRQAVPAEPFLAGRRGLLERAVDRGQRRARHCSATSRVASSASGRNCRISSRRARRTR